MCVLEDSVLSRDIVNLNCISIYESLNATFPPHFFIELEKTLLLGAHCALCTMLGAQRYLLCTKISSHKQAMHKQCAMQNELGFEMELHFLLLRPLFFVI